MRLGKWGSIIVFSSMLMAYVEIAHAEIYIATEMVSTELQNHTRCIVNAKDTLRFMGFEKGLGNSTEEKEDGSLSAWGRKKSGDTAVIKCISLFEEQEIVLVVVAGNKQSEVKKLAERLARNFPTK